MSQIFISYSKQNIDFARMLRRKLETAGFPVWMDESALLASERWWHRIEENVRACSAFIVIMSDESANSDWVERELLLAERLRKPIFPILIEGEPWSRLANIQYVPMVENATGPLPFDLVDGLTRYVTPRPGEVALTPAPRPETMAHLPPPEPSQAQPRSRLPIILGAVASIAIIMFALALILPSLSVAPPSPTPAAPTADPASLPNLSVGRLRTSPRNPSPGEVFILSITLQNTGAADSGAFNWTWDSSLTDPVALNTLVGRVESIPPNGSKNISFPVSYGWWGEYNTQLVVDIDSEVAETDDRDNRRPFLLTLSDEPFEIDFALLPPAVVVEPPATVSQATFDEWNLRFTLLPPEGRDCPDARLRIVEDAGDLMLQVESAIVACQLSRVRVDVLKASVGAVVAEFSSAAAGETASVSVFETPDATEPLFVASQSGLALGEIAIIGDDTTLNRSIRSFVLATSTGPVRVTRLILFRQTP